MKLRNTHLFLLLILLMLSVHNVFAHAPDKPGDNESLATAYEISDPAKSWALYAELHEGEEAQYYKFELPQNERLLVMLFAPTSEESSFLPNLVVMGPGITSQDAVPEYVETVEGDGIMLLEGQRSSRPTYEAFTPSSFYELASLDQEDSASGTYHVAVYETSQGGHYGLAIGYREQFGLDEFIRIPIDVIGIHQWEGQSLLFIFAPLIFTLVIGLAILILKRPVTFRTLLGGIGVFAGLLYLGSGFMTLTQTILALTTATPDLSVVLTAIFILIPILLALATFRLTINREHITARVRIFMAILGVLGLFAWAGLLIGPALALIASLMPSKQF
ncbi:MAG: hypothetical protein OEY44_03125 [Candidatus Peregrinibacteria bacterium]|nr:hypothetical protein [Candidatus Peregrinibacteria bacterium]